jgi:NAD(P)-dependent dehydrogenase (short-subunit alcohol dehydrogenase family)
VTSAASDHAPVVVVTGGSQGVGLGIARTFLRHGGSVVTCARSTFERPPAAETDEQFARTLHVTADVRDPEDLDRVIDATVDRFGRLDVLVNNAGGQPPADIATVSPRFIQKTIELNLTAPIIAAQKANRVMQQQVGGGTIINISSQASMPGSGGGALAPYGAAKAGLNHVTRSLATAWGPKVRVNCVSLGWVETEAMADLLLPANREQWASTLQRIPMRRMGTPDEIGSICRFLTLPEAGYITGATIWADGGGT